MVTAISRDSAQQVPHVSIASECEVAVACACKFGSIHLKRKNAFTDVHLVVRCVVVLRVACVRELVRIGFGRESARDG